MSCTRGKFSTGSPVAGAFTLPISMAAERTWVMRHSEKIAEAISSAVSGICCSGKSMLSMCGIMVVKFAWGHQKISRCIDCGQSNNKLFTDANKFIVSALKLMPVSSHL